MKSKHTLLLLILLCTAIVSIIDGIIMPGYVVKSAAKLVLFGLVPVLYARWAGIPLRGLLQMEKRDLRRVLLLAAAIFSLILGGYFVLRGFVDFSGITESLTTNAGVSREIFPFVAVYIPLVNALLEEFFFRGFAFLTLRRFFSAKFAYLYSAVVFAVYHVSILQGWFSPAIYALAMTGLAVGGLLFDWVDSRAESLLPSYLVHMSANLAINTVGLILFGLIG
ncbi:MAG: CPBP family intramembrane metalloprotease [Oscillospiraceae bacterium]|nr:CPBP family intramembrane metalloprotease [Oscillospiraceae bacterium]